MAETEFEVVVSFEVDGTEKTFFSVDELLEFIEGEIEFYGWLDGADQKLFSNVKSHIPQRMHGARNYLNTDKSQKTDDNLRHAIDVFTTLYTHSKTPHSQSLVGGFLVELVEECGANVAAAALAAIRHDPVTDSDDPEVIQGRTLLAMHLSPFLQLNYKGAARTLKTLVKKHETENEKLKESHRKTVREGRELLHNHSNHFDKLVQEKAESRDELDAKVSAALESLSQTEQTYKAFMGLKAPVEYWKDKATRHKEAVERNLVTLILFAAVGGITLIWMLWGIANTALSWADVEPPVAVFLTLATVGVAATTGVIWILRVMVRNYLSEKHLAFDAEERSTMLQTYLAFIEGGINAPEERKLLLQSIFRPTADGIVKDDAAPSFPGQNIISGG